MAMPSFSRNNVILVAYPFSDRSGVKVRPAVVVSGEHVPLPSPISGPADTGLGLSGTLQKKTEVAMSLDIQLDSMSVAEKVQLLESVWQSLCACPADVQSPEWHREVLEERRRRLEDGRVTISAWADAKARLMQLGR